VLKSNVSIKNYLTTVYYLIRRDLSLFWKAEFLGKLLNTSILFFTILVTFGYFLPAYGLKPNYGPFLLVGVIAGYAFFEIMGKVAVMTADIQGDRTILYTLTLPIPSWLVFVYMGVSWAICTSIMNFLMFPLGKLLLFSQFDLTKINLFKLPLIFIMTNLFCGFFALWLGSIFKKMSGIPNLFVRIINPMYSFGGGWFSWFVIHDTSPILAYIDLVNPLVYIMEGMRAATLGQEGYLPFWFSLSGITVFTLGFAWDAVRRLQKRLDCVC
jgi:ABC-2 type transport system permease protein